MKIYITGIAGFLGSHLAKRFLMKGHTVAGCDNLIGGYLDNCPAPADFKQIDILDYASLSEHMKGSDIVIHTAALAYEGLSVFSPKLVTENIYAGTMSVATSAVACKAKLLLNCSSMARYGLIEPPFTEASICNPIDPYGLAKYQAEQAINLMSDIHGIKVIHVVPHNIIGTHQKYDDPYRNVVSIFINSLLQSNKLIIYGDGLQKRSFSPVVDCLNAIIKIIERDNIANKEIFNIGPEGNEMTIKDLAYKIAHLCAIYPSVQYLADRPQEVKNAWCSSEKARVELNYSPNTNINDTIKEMVDWIKGKGPKPFDYKLPIEIINEKTPKTWTEKLY
jgi:UDP-glucose 4-epimerase